MTATPNGYVEERKSYKIPPAVGTAGYLRVLDAILQLARVQKISVTPGSIEYLRLRAEDEPEHSVEVELETLMPYSIIRNRPLDELVATSPNAAVVIGQLFTAATLAGLHPAGLVTGADTWLYRWYHTTTGSKLAKGHVFGAPLLVDSNLPSETLVLCAAHGPYAKLVDTVRSFKITMWSSP